VRGQKGIDLSHMNYIVINSLIIETTLFIKSLLTSLYQREVLYPIVAKRGKGRFSDSCKFNFETLYKSVDPEFPLI